MDHVVGYSREWIVGQVDDRYICPICYEVLRNPRQCKNGHNCCEVCLHQLMMIKKECPICKCVLDDENVGINILAKSIVDDMVSKCYVEEEGWLHEDDACMWTGPLHSREGHISACQFRSPVTCPWDMGEGEGCIGCIGQYSRGGLRDHYLQLTQALAAEAMELRKKIDSLQGITVSGFSLVQDKHRSGKVETFCGEVRKSDKNIKEGRGFEQVSSNFSRFNHTYIGEYLNDLRHGFGHFKSRSFDYKGMWENGMCHGECLAFFRKEDNMERHGSGTFRNNVMHGLGKIWSNNSKFSFSGDFVDDKRHGHGTLVNADGKKTFVGQFIDDKIMGEGVMTFFNKTTLTGKFEGVYCFGEGTLRDQLGAVVYTGMFTRGEKNGIGVMRYASGDCYNGSFVKDKKCGQGVMVFADKSVYSGRFYNDKCHGKGRVTSKDGVIGDIQEFYRGEVVE